MIELRKDRLEFTFPEVHPQAKLTVSMVRTLRVPDDGRSYPLPAGFGNLPMFHVDDFASRLPEQWAEHGGVMIPMYQAEALWLSFSSQYITDQGNYPFAVKVLTGKVSALTGQKYSAGLTAEPQNYLVAPKQPWIDGFFVGKGIVRQFVAARLGEGYTAEEQITGLGEFGGMQLIVYPMKREEFEKRFPKETRRSSTVFCHRKRLASARDMGIAPGGVIKQTIYKDAFGIDNWDQSAFSRCFVHILNSRTWRDATGHNPPSKPITAKRYLREGIPWFDYYSEELESLESEPPLEQLLSLGTLMKAWQGKKLKDNKSLEPAKVIGLGRKKGDQVREGKF